MVPACWDFLKGSYVDSSCWESPTWAWAKPFRGLALVSGCGFLLWMVIAVLETLALWLERWYGTLPRYGRADRDQPTANHPADQVSIWARQHCQGTVKVLCFPGNCSYGAQHLDHLPSGLTTCHSHLPGRGAMKVCSREDVTQKDSEHGAA